MKPLLLADDTQIVLSLRLSKNIDLGPTQEKGNFASCDNVSLSYCLWRLSLALPMIAVLSCSLIIPKSASAAVAIAAPAESETPYLSHSLATIGNFIIFLQVSLSDSYESDNGS